MSDLFSLVKRHIKVFTRDRSAVFFSFFSVIIMLALYLLFLIKLYEEPFVGTNINSQTKTVLLIGQMMGGVLVINSLSLPLGMLGTIISDMKDKKLDSFLVSPVKRSKIIISYFITAFLVTITLSLFMLLVTILYVGISSGHWYQLRTILETVGLISLYAFISSSIMIFIVTLIKSSGAFSALSGILGTLVGFTSGIYMPMRVLGQIKHFSALLPFTHMTIYLKNSFLREGYEMLPSDVPEAVVTDIKDVFGTNHIKVLGLNINQPVMLIIIVGISILLLALALRNLSKKTKA